MVIVGFGLGLVMVVLELGGGGFGGGMLGCSFCSMMGFWGKNFFLLKLFIGLLFGLNICRVWKFIFL